MPSENEWIIMEVLWNAQEPLTAAHIISKLQGVKDVSPKTIRVLLNRLLKKKIIGYQVDPEDSRVYHYYVRKDRDTCLKEKSRHFINSYFQGNPFGMVASFVQNDSFSAEQIDELIGILEQEKQKGKAGDTDG